MKVYFKGNIGAVRYRNTGFVDEKIVVVTPEWFKVCKNPNIVEYVAKAKTKTPKKKASPAKPTIIETKKPKKGFFARLMD